MAKVKKILNAEAVVVWQDDNHFSFIIVVDDENNNLYEYGQDMVSKDKLIRRN